MISLAGGLRRRQRISFKAAPAPAASGPAFRAASSTTTITGGGGFTLTAPAGTVAGDVLIVQFFDVIDSKSGVVGTAPAGWTQQGTGDDGNYPHIVWRTFTRVATGSDSFVWSGGANWTAPLAAAMIAVSGGSDVDVAGTVSFAGATAASVTTTAPTLLVGLWATFANSTAAPASMTARSNVNHIGLSQVIATQELTATGATGTRVSPTSSGLLRFAQLIAVK